MKYYNLCLLIAILLCSPSCKKHPSYALPQQPIDDTVPLLVPNYTMLNPDNYWIYAEYVIDEDGNALATGDIDSCYIEKDTTIARVRYMKLVKEVAGGTEVQLLRDSLHYIVTNFGNIIFSPFDFTTVFSEKLYISQALAPPPYDTIASVKTFMGEKDKFITVPAGTFKTSAFIRAYEMRYPHNRYGNVRNYYFRYAENIGLVSETISFYLQSPTVYERRLLRYQVKR